MKKNISEKIASVNLKNNQDGLTLVELLVVVFIIAILASFVISKYLIVVEDAKDTESVGNVRAIYSILVTYNKRYHFAGESLEITERDLLEESGVNEELEYLYYVRVLDEQDVLIQTLSKSGHIVTLTQDGITINYEPTIEDMEVFLLPSQFLWGTDIIEE